MPEEAEDINFERGEKAVGCTHSLKTEVEGKEIEVGITEGEGTELEPAFDQSEMEEEVNNLLNAKTEDDLDEALENVLSHENFLSIYVEDEEKSGVALLRGNPESKGPAKVELDEGSPKGEPTNLHLEMAKTTLKDYLT